MDILLIVEIIVSILLIALILIQERSSGLSGVFGGGGESSYKTRRGFEKIIFTSTIIAAIAFVVLALAKLIVG